MEWVHPIPHQKGAEARSDHLFLVWIVHPTQLLNHWQPGMYSVQGSDLPPGPDIKLCREFERAAQGKKDI